MSLRELLDAATPGPWEYDGFEHVVSPEITDIVCGLWQRPAADGVPDPQTETDARLIALAPELAQLCLDMGEAGRELLIAAESLTNPDEVATDGIEEHIRAARMTNAVTAFGPLLARFDQLGVREDGQIGKEAQA